MKIVVDSYVLDNESKNIKDLLEDFKNHRRKYSQELDSMSSCWQGDDYEYFIKQMVEFNNQCYDFELKIKNMIAYMETYCKNFEELDKNFEDKKINLE